MKHVNPPSPWSSPRRPARGKLLALAACALMLAGCATQELPPYNPGPLPPLPPLPPLSRPATGTPSAPGASPADPGVITTPIPSPESLPSPPSPQNTPSAPSAQTQAPILTETAPSGSAPALDNICNAEPAQFAVGQPYSISLLNQVRERSNARGVRLLRPGDIITMDFNPQRANLVLDADNRVAEVRCG